MPRRGNPVLPERKKKIDRGKKLTERFPVSVKELETSEFFFPVENHNVDASVAKWILPYRKFGQRS